MSPDATASIKDEIALLRGRIIGSFAEIEAALVDLLCQCRALPGYRTITTLPHSLDKRLSLLRRLAGIQGPLSAHREQITSATKQIRELGDLRNIAAHGIVLADDRGEILLEHRSPHTIIGSAAPAKTANLQQLSRAADDTAAFANKFALVVSRICLDFRLEGGCRYDDAHLD